MNKRDSANLHDVIRYAGVTHTAANNLHANTRNKAMKKFAEEAMEKSFDIKANAIKQLDALEAKEKA